MTHRKRHQRFKLKSLYLWHRYIGLAAALFVILLAATGIALNHTERFNFDHRFVQSSLLLDWYGIEAPVTATHYTAAGNAVALLDTQLFINNKKLEGEYYDLTGSLMNNEILLVAQQDDILLLTPAGELIERLRHNTGVPQDIERIGLTADGVMIAATASGQQYRADADFLKWTTWPGDAQMVNWSNPSTLSDSALGDLQDRFRGQILPWERVMLDLHSGRIFGSWGTWLMDAAALLMLFLASSGVIIWWKRQR